MKNNNHQGFFNDFAATDTCYFLFPPVAVFFLTFIFFVIYQDGMLKKYLPDTLRDRRADFLLVVNILTQTKKKTILANFFCFDDCCFLRLVISQER